MPIYEYKCSVCLLNLEIEKSIFDDKTPICCQKNMEKIWTVPTTIFNGSGFYSTDNRKK